MDFMQLAQSFGVPTALLAVIMMFVWRASSWFAREVVKPLVDNHVAFVGRVASSQDAIATALKGIQDVLAKK